MARRTVEVLSETRRLEAYRDAKKYPYTYYTLAGGERLFVLGPQWENVTYPNDLMNILKMNDRDICFTPSHRGFRMVGTNSLEGVAEFTTFQTVLSQLEPTEVTPE